MRDRKVLELLRRIARGLPVAVGPLVVGLSTSCTQCQTLYLAASSHPASPLVESYVGPPERFDAARCDALCRVLDGLAPLDAPGLDAGASDAGFPLYLPTPYPERAVATCAYDGTGAALYCNYTEQICQTSACGPAVLGRTPAGLVMQRSLAATPLARWLADGAHLEAASVPAFDDLAAELTAFRAPAALVRAARRSADDERRHARLLGRLAHRLGAAVPEVRRTPTELRGPEEVALDNAAKGCAGEAYAALTAAHQAEHAASTAARRAFRTIAKDEARHALLSFAVSDWLASHLSLPARRRTEEARQQSLAELATSAEHEPAHELREVLGLPDATRSRDLLAVVSRPVAFAADPGV